MIHCICHIMSFFRFGSDERLNHLSLVCVSFYIIFFIHLKYLKGTYFRGRSIQVGVLTTAR